MNSFYDILSYITPLAQSDQDDVPLNLETGGTSGGNQCIIA